MKPQGQALLNSKRFLRGKAYKLKEINIFLIDMENERLNIEYGKIICDHNNYGIGSGFYPKDYLQGIFDEEQLTIKDWMFIFRNKYNNIFNFLSCL